MAPAGWLSHNWEGIKSRFRLDWWQQSYMHKFTNKTRGNFTHFANSYKKHWRANDCDAALSFRISDALDAASTLVKRSKAGAKVGRVTRVGRHLCQAAGDFTQGFGPTRRRVGHHGHIVAHVSEILGQRYACRNNVSTIVIPVLMYFSVPVSILFQLAYFSIPFLYQSFFLFYFYSSFMQGNLQAWHFSVIVLPLCHCGQSVIIYKKNC